MRAVDGKQEINLEWPNISLTGDLDFPESAVTPEYTWSRIMGYSITMDEGILIKL